MVNEEWIGLAVLGVVLVTLVLVYLVVFWTGGDIKEQSDDRDR